MAVVSLQKVSKGLSPYFTLVGNYQTINGSNDFSDFSANVFIEELNKLAHVVILNHIILLDQPPCPYDMLIVGWWCSITRAEAKRTLDSVPIVTVLF